MEDILKFLFVAAIIGVAIVSQVRKEARKKAPRKPVVPTPGHASPLSTPHEEDATYGGFIPEGPTPSTPHPFIPLRTTPLQEGQRTTKERQPQKSGTATPPQANADEDFGIHSAEDARRAIIWGEILTRKY